MEAKIFNVLTMPCHPQAAKPVDEKEDEKEDEIFMKKLFEISTTEEHILLRDEILKETVTAVKDLTSQAEIWAVIQKSGRKVDVIFRHLEDLEKIKSVSLAKGHNLLVGCTYSI